MILCFISGAKLFRFDGVGVIHFRRIVALFRGGGKIQVLHESLGKESVMAPSGLWGRRGSSLPAFGEKRRKTEVSTPLLYYRAERVWKGRRFGGRSIAESVNLPVPLCP